MSRGEGGREGREREGGREGRWEKEREWKMFEVKVKKNSIKKEGAVENVKIIKSKLTEEGKKRTERDCVYTKMAKCSTSILSRLTFNTSQRHSNRADRACL